MSVKGINSTFRRLQWKLTFSYTAVTLGSLLIAVFVLGYLLFSWVFIPLDIYRSVLTPRDWFRILNETSTPMLSRILGQEPLDPKLISFVMEEADLQITDYDILQIGDFQIRLGTVGRGSALLVDFNGILLGASGTEFTSEDDIGKPLDVSILPGLGTLLDRALSGENNPDKLFSSLEPGESFYLTLPVLDDTGQSVLGVVILHMEHLPTANDIPATLWTLMLRSVVILLLAAGIVGTIFGAFTANGIVSRLGRISQVTDAWSRGDFSEFIEDRVGDEISLLVGHLNRMAEQLQRFIIRSKEMVISEERGRLARDLHDSAKQEALAASFHLGTALTLFESDPKSAKNHLTEADNLVNSVRTELTDLIHELRPPSMNGRRYDETLHEYLIEWAHQSGIDAELSVEGSLEISLEVKQAIYRIMQEALANIARHSAAESAAVSLNYLESRLEFSVRDDGKGFDPSQQHDGMGLDSMRERVEALGGDFNIESSMGKGTLIEVSLPTSQQTPDTTGSF
jgi:signal transduction histidine kinase